MAGSKYLALLRDSRWQRKRLEALQAADWACDRCEATDKTLNVHHRRYRPGAMPWEYEIFELQVLCEDCHVKVEKGVARLKTALAEVLLVGDLDLFERCAGYLLTQAAMQPPLPALTLHSANEVDGAADALGMGEAEIAGELSGRSSFVPWQIFCRERLGVNSCRGGRNGSDA